MQQLSGLDAMFVHAEMHGMPMHFCSVAVYDPSSLPDGKLEFRQLITHFEQTMQQSIPKLRWKLSEIPLQLDQPYWIEDQNFDLVYHFRHIALPRPGNWAKFCALIANIHAQPLNRDRPLWEAYVIDGLDNIEGFPSGCFAMLLKIHHSMMDGNAAMALFSRLHSFQDHRGDAAKDMVAGDHNLHVEPGTIIGMPEVLARAARNNISRAGKLALLAGRSLGMLFSLKMAVRNHEFRLLHKPKTRFNGSISPRRVVDRVRIPMADIQTIKTAYPNVTINDVALTIISGALRMYLSNKDELPEESLVATVPINIRDKEEKSPEGNYLGVTNVCLRSDISDPAIRLQIVHKEAIAGKNYARSIGRHILVDVLDNLYGGLVAWSLKAAVQGGLLEKFPPANNTIVTNIPGFPIRAYLCGARMVDSFGMGPLIPNTGLFHAVSSADNHLSIAFTADRQKMEDPDVYAECLHASYASLLDAVKISDSDKQQELKPTIKSARKKRTKFNKN